MSDGEIIEICENSELDEFEKTGDSDCEIQEEDVPVIEVVESDEETCAEVCTNGTIEELVEMDDTKDKSIPKVEENIHIDTLFKITFYEEENFKNLKDCLISTLKDSLLVKGISTDVRENEEEGFNIYFIKNDEIPEPDLNDMIDNNSLHAEEDKEEEEQGNEDIADGLFLIDTTPAEKIDAGTIPSYKRSIKDVLKNDAKKSKASNDICSRPKLINTCFNCFGTHSLKDCPEPRNHSRINKARKQFMEGRTGDRYHVDIEQRFAHLRPGQLSSNLKKALGVGRGQLPAFLYRMRALGYPPGWLEEAKVAHSGIVLFDSEGNAVLGSDEEDGEVENERHKYDITKIISFPGYNVDPGPDYYDEYKFHGVPPMQIHDRKEEFIKSLGDNIAKGYKRKKLKNLSVPTVEDTELRASMPADMEIEDIDEEIIQYSVNPPLPLLPPLPPPLPAYSAFPPPPPPDDSDTRSTPVNQIDIIDLRDSPSLEDLEAKQKQLLAALEKSGTFLDATYKEDSLIDEVLELENFESEEEKSQASEATTVNTEQSENIEGNSNCDSCHSPQTPAGKTSKLSSILGTPILKFSPYDRLPEGDLFKKGVSDVINFENLPNSTGKYENIKVVIQKVRTIVTQLNEET